MLFTVLEKSLSLFTLTLTMQFFSVSSPRPDLAAEDLIPISLSSDTKPRPDSTVEGVNFKRNSISYRSKISCSEEDLTKLRTFCHKENNFPPKLKNKTACNRSFAHFLRCSGFFV